jgi:hypothetical protein
MALRLGGGIKFGDAGGNEVFPVFRVVALDGHGIELVGNLIVRVDVARHLQQRRHLPRRNDCNFQCPSCIWGGNEAHPCDRQRPNCDCPPKQCAAGEARPLEFFHVILP